MTPAQRRQWLEQEKRAIAELTAALEKQLRAALRDEAAHFIEGLEAATPELQAAVLLTLQDAAGLGVDAAVEQLSSIGLGVDWALPNQAAREWARSYHYDLIRDINKTSQDVLRKEIDQWMGSGEHLNKLKESLSPYFGDRRARTIAMTETTRAYAEGNVATWRAGGLADRRPEKAPPAHVGCRCNISIEEQADGSWAYIWNTANDERVCFPAGTLVDTDNGKWRIENIKVGDRVLTRMGYQRVIGTSKRNYSGAMTTVVHEQGMVTCTANHPVWALEKGWLEAGQLLVGDSLQAANKKASRIIRVTQFCVGNANNLPAPLVQVFGLSPVANGVLMPIDAIHLQGGPQIGQQEINAIAANFGLLNESDIVGLKDMSGLLLKRGLSLEGAVTSKATELPIGSTGANSKFLAAVSTLDVARRAAALLTTKPGGPSRLTRFESLAASFAGVGLLYSGAAFATTNGVTVSHALDNGKLFATDGTSLGDNLGVAPLLETGAAAKPATLPNLADIQIGFLAASWAGDHAPGLRGLVVAFIRAVDSIMSGLLSALKDLSATVASVLIGHETHSLSELIPLYHRSFVSANQPVKVYNLQVERLPEFYANGVLVHNCPICEPLNNRPVGLAKEAPKVEP